MEQILFSFTEKERTIETKLDDFLKMIHYKLESLSNFYNAHQ